MSHDYTPGRDDATNQLIDALLRAQPHKLVNTSPKRFAPEPERNFKVQPALCLDLDGTIRFSANGTFINKPDDVRLYPDVEAKLWKWREKGYLLFGISNQGGVAFGHKTAQGNDAEIEAMFALFDRNPFHVVKCCYHDPRGKIAPWNHRSLLRKPDVGMLALCEVEAFQGGYSVDWDHSLMVGDRPEDQELATRAGIGFQWAWEFFSRPEPKASD